MVVATSAARIVYRSFILEWANGGDQRAGTVDFPFVKPCKPGSVASHGSALVLVRERLRSRKVNPHGGQYDSDEQDEQYSGCEKQKVLENDGG